jgi:xanthine permease
MTQEKDPIYELKGRISLRRAIPFGLQHVLAMFVANIAPILIVAGAVHLPADQAGQIVQAAMIIAGIGSLLQMFPIGPLGSGLPIIMGISFTFVSVFCVIGAKYGYGAILGAALIGGILEGTLGLFAKYWRRFVPPIVSASVVTAIGFSLLPIGANSFGGGAGNPEFGEAKYLIVGLITLVSCLVWQIKAVGYRKQLAVLFGLVIGYIAALCFGMVDGSKIASSSLIAIPTFMPYPMEFHGDAIFSVVLIFLVSATETLGDTSALASVGFNRNVKDKEVRGSIAVDGYVSSFSSLWGGLPITSFSQNVGLIAMTHVVNRKAIAAGAAIMIIAGFFPGFGALLASLPDSVLGGCTLMMFGSIVVSGIRMISECGYDSRNMSIAALSLSIGLGFTQVPQIFHVFPALIQSVLGENCVAVVFIVAVALNILFPKNGLDDEMEKKMENAKSKKD